MSKFSILLGLIFVIPAFEIAGAQNDPVIRYLPLDIGNSWTYIDVLYPPPDFQPDTLWQGGAALSEQVVFNDTLYFKGGFGFIGGSGIREDDAGNIRVFVESQPFSFLMFDFYLDDGTVIEYGPDHPIFPGRVLTVSTSGSIGQNARPSSISLQYSRPGAVDSDWYYSFEAGLGITSYGGGIGEFWRLHTATIDGQIINTDVESDHGVLGEITLENNFPNPFSINTTIKFSIPTQTHVRLSVYNVLGREIAILADARKNPGKFAIDFSGTDLPPGIYFFRLETAQQRITRKMILIR